MARKEARVSVDIWTDTDFVALPPSAQRTYLLLISQRDMAYTGVIGLRERRWSRTAAGITPADVMGDLAVLEAARFVLVDENTEEVLVRTFMRNDKVYRQPNVFQSVVEQLDSVQSPRLRAELLNEMRLIDAAGDMPKGSFEHRDAIFRKLGNPTEYPSQYPSGNPSDMALGGGGVVTTSSTASPFPSPLSSSPLDASGADEPGEGEEGSPEDEEQDLIAEVLAIRPGWSARSVSKVLRDPEVRRRPWPVVRAAAVAVARDGASEAPGRLRHDGPWWNAAGVPSAPAGPVLPPQCGGCDRNRMVELADGRMAFCPNCNPRARRSA